MFISDEGTILYHSAPHKLFMVLKTLNLRSFIFPIFSNSHQELRKNNNKKKCTEIIFEL